MPTLQCQAREPGRVIIRLVGPPATGKSVLRRYLAERLGIPAFGIDEERQVYGWTPAAWPSLAAKVTSTSACIMETSGNSPNDRAVCRGRPTLTILCLASQAVRKRRLQQRVEDEDPMTHDRPDYVDTLLALRPPSLHPHFVIRSDYGFDPKELRHIEQACRTFLSGEG